MDPLRIPLDTPVETRNFNVSKDAMLTNCFVDATATDKKVVRRPGLDLKVSGLGAGNGIFYYDGQLWNTSQSEIGPGLGPKRIIGADSVKDRPIISDQAKTLCLFSSLYNYNGYSSVVITFNGTALNLYGVAGAHGFHPLIFIDGKGYFQEVFTAGPLGQQYQIYHTTDFTTYTPITGVYPLVNPIAPLITDGITLSTSPDQVNWTIDFSTWSYNFSSFIGPNPVGNGTTATTGVANYNGNGMWAPTGISSLSYVFHFNGFYFCGNDGSAHYRSPDDIISYSPVSSNIATFGSPTKVASSSTRAVSYRAVGGPATFNIKSHYTTDGLTWMNDGVLPGFTYNAGDIMHFNISSANGIFLLVTQNNTSTEKLRYFKSPDGINWTEIYIHSL